MSTSLSDYFLNKNSGLDVASECNALADRLTSLEDAAELITEIRVLAGVEKASADRTYSWWCT